ncbi:transglutaminase-like domain-containing protein [Sulfurimonas sp. HSL3-7]|uniref:transglutaminase-like domain-containing protein n=1 Tax=Sulfonitrofixus jiaomeiensis TaxID=3131938 RepID=UPI0031F85A7E
MMRRVCALLFSLLLGGCALYGAEGSHRYLVTQQFVIDGPGLKLWVPLPLESGYQKASDLAVEGNFERKAVNADSTYGAQMLHLAFAPQQKHNTATVRFTVEVHDRKADFNRSGVKASTEELAPYRAGSEHIRIDGVVKAYAERITTGETDDLQKARRIYDWTVQNMFRDPKTRGCGLGDAYQSLESGYLGGKCADVSAVFVALLRAAGIPAREVFGIRVAKSKYSKAYGVKSADITTAQHCRAEFYIEGTGWIPADPADVTKLILVEGLDRDSERVKAEAERQFGNWEMNWFAYNSARDFVLTPAPVQFPLSIFSYPYAERGDEPLDYYSPKNFTYTITVKELP